MGGLPRVSEVVKSCPLPSIFLSNVNHVLNKLDELHALVEIYKFDVVCITESWLNESVPNHLCDFGDYSIFRRDRTSGLGGGVLCYVGNSIQSLQINPVLCKEFDNDFEIIWVLLRPYILPRPLSCVILANVYVPPWYNAELCRLLKSYIILCRLFSFQIL